MQYVGEKSLLWFPLYVETEPCGLGMKCKIINMPVIIMMSNHA